jgi:hypothetical protein
MVKKTPQQKFSIVKCCKPKDVKCDKEIRGICCWNLKDKMKCGYMVVT